jgi:uncharacterized protein DUF3999
MKAFPALLLVFIAASPQIRYFRYQRPVQMPAQQSGQACVSIDPEIFTHAAPQLADLRLYANGAETPYIIRTSTSITGSEKIVPLLNTGVRNGQTVFDAEMPEGRYSDLELTIGTHDFIATVTVAGSDALSGGPQTRLRDFTIFDLTRQRLGRSTVLHLPESNMRFLHFRVAGPLKPEEVAGLSVGRMPSTPAGYRTAAESRQATQKDRNTVIEFNLPANVPVDRIVFEPNASPAVFSRDVTVNASANPQKPANDHSQPPYAITSTGNLLRVHTREEGKRLDEERLTIEAPREQFDTPSKWTITIANGDDVPISLKTVRLEMLERNLCFDAAADAGYTLYYGDPALSAPQYDYARLFSPQPNALQASIAPEQMNAGYQDRPDDRPFTEKHPILLWVTLVAAIAVLWFIAYSSQKSANKAT